MGDAFGELPGMVARSWLARALAAGALAAGCIQGPWDYYPDETPPFRGIWMTGYALAGKPVENVCFEKLHALDEESTDAFAFYDSAEVTVSGRFGDTAATLRLFPLAEAPNCFAGDSTVVAAPGEDYRLSARFVWDSAGATVRSALAATARVPVSFHIRRTAAAPRLASTGGIPSDLFTSSSMTGVLQFFETLPPDVREVMIGEYGADIVALEGDTAAIREYFLKNGRAIQERLVGLLEKDKYQYGEGDTVYYLNGAFNTLSHYYTSDRSGDVDGVLITHQFDTAAGRPETRFDSFLGLEPDSSDFYFPGRRRRLIMYPDAFGPDGWQVLDSIGFVNTWFHTGLNRIYFYGFEQAYMDFVSTAVDGESDSRIVPRYNVTGGRGIFAGAVPDSFDVFVRADSFTTVYSLQEARGAFCRDVGWFDRPYCASYYREHCAARAWRDGDCAADAVRAGLEADLAGDTALARAVDSAYDAARDAPAMAGQVRQGEIRFCAENAFPESVPECGEWRDACISSAGINECKQSLWAFCKDALWRPAQCGNALAWYCRDNPRRSEVLCRQADAYCAEEAHKDEAACRR
jgi:hypothetical protein